ncbi:RDD family protein [Streptomyces flaveolus]|uniref:RDD family protein n=1 Tax=Streptomyces flaveolus TaxID=67297 RepID=UPI00340BE5B0
MSHSTWNASPGRPQENPYSTHQQYSAASPRQDAHGNLQQSGQDAHGHISSPPGSLSFAGWWSRAGATMIDGLLLGVPNGVLAAIGGIMAATGGNTWVIVAVILLSVIVLIGTYVWQLVQEGRSGQTIGKKALGIRLVRIADGQPLGVVLAFVRRLCHFIDSLVFYLGWLLPIWDAKKQTLADKIVDSVVLKVR